MVLCLDCPKTINSNNGRKRCPECAHTYNKKRTVEQRRIKNTEKNDWGKPRECPQCHEIFIDDKRFKAGDRRKYCTPKCTLAANKQPPKPLRHCVACNGTLPPKSNRRTDCDECKIKKKQRYCACGTPTEHMKTFCSECLKVRRRAQWRKYVAERNARKKNQILHIEDQTTPVELRNLLASSNVCVYCDESFDELTFDHIIPLIKGGTHHIDNIVLACRSCNSSKQELTLEEWAVSGRPKCPEKIKVSNRDTLW